MEENNIKQMTLRITERLFEETKKKPTRLAAPTIRFCLL